MEKLPRGIRHNSKSGTFFIIRKNTDLEKYLNGRDDLFKNPNELQWLPWNNSLPINKDSCQGKTALIIGKGPSLDLITKEMIDPNMVVIACNEAINIVEMLDLPNQIFWACIDVVVPACTFDGDVLTSMFVKPKFEDTNQCYIHPNTSGLSLVGSFAASCAKLLGINNIVLTAFDGAFGGSVNVAASLNVHKKNRSNDSYRKHGAIIKTALVDTKWEHVSLVENQDVTFCDILQQSQDNLQSLYEQTDSQH